MSAVESPLMTVSELARFLRVDARTVRRMCQRGELPAIRVGRQWRVDVSPDEAFTVPREHVRGENPVTGRIR